MKYINLSKPKGFVAMSIVAALAFVVPVASAAPDAWPDAAPDPRIERESSDYAINSSSLMVTPGITRLVETIDSMSKNGVVNSISIVGSASPDGPTALNDRLALRRARALANYIASQTNLNPDFIRVSSAGENVDGFISMMRQSSNPAAKRVLEIYQSEGTEAQHEAQIRALDGGKVWLWLAADVFPKLRTAEITVDGEDTIVKMTVAPEAKDSEMEVINKVQEPLLVEEEVVAEEVIAETPKQEEDEWIRGLYLKTNMPAWFMLWTNLAVEIDLAPHWSFTLPVYYSGFNYFKHTVKFRTLTVMPEFRYWFKGDNVGPFVGAHFGLGWYNAAFNGDYRYQDHYKHTPAVGGGLAVGWRFYFCRNHHWSMEATLGGGIYKLDYDLFRNEYNGPLVGRRKRTFYGIDQAALTISYRFDVEKKPKKQAVIEEGGEK